MVTHSSSSSRPPSPRTRAPGLRLAALAAVTGYGVVRASWALGGRWGLSVCDRTTAHDPTELATGCGAAQVELSWWQGWGSVVGCGVLVLVAGLVVVVGHRYAACAAGGLAALLVALSFPGHLLFEIPAGWSGRATDWRDVADRLVLLALGLLLAASAWTRRTAEGTGGRRTGPPRWARGWTYAAAVIPVLGFSLPHLLWFLGLPVGIDPAMLPELRSDLGWGPAMALCLAPVGGALLTTGLTRRWGRRLPRWLPLLGDRPVPRMLAVVPAGVVAVALVSYGLIGLGVVGRALSAGTTTAADLARGWAVFGTEVVFLLWGVALAVATVGYHLGRESSADAGPGPGGLSRTGRRRPAAPPRHP